MTEKSVLLTGATGLIGKETIAPLLKHGFKVHAFTIDNPNPNVEVNWIRANLFDINEVNRHIQALRPSYLLNMAWATIGDYLTNDVNYAFLSAGINLIRSFVRNGGRRLVCVGSCLEYKPKDAPIHETDELACEKNAYVFCKNELNRIATRICSESGVSFGYGRIFYTFGRNEDNRRLAGAIVSKLTKNERVTITSGPLIRDYMYAKDVAAALVSLLASDVEGQVNIASGKATTIHDLAITLAEALGKPHLIDFQTNASNQAPSIVANTSRLKGEVHFSPSFTLQSAAKDLVESLHAEQPLGRGPQHA